MYEKCVVFVVSKNLIYWNKKKDEFFFSKLNLGGICIIILVEISWFY